MNKNKPWLPKEVNNILLSWIKENDVGFEWGSGTSTCWFAEKSKKITSIEHNPEWFKIVNKKLRKRGLKKIDFQLLESDNPRKKQQEYVASISAIQDSSLDYCLVDGILRDQCTLACLKKIKAGGLLIIDDIQRYFPNTINTRAPYARKKDAGYATPVWEEVGKKINNWRQIRLSNGMKDTSIFIKP